MEQLDGPRAIELESKLLTSLARTDPDTQTPTPSWYQKPRPVAAMRHHFLDSGAFTQKLEGDKYFKEHPEQGKWAYFDQPEFWEYVDNYAAFVDRYKVAIDYYANVDVIPNPKLTWRNHKYLEREHGLNPVPVVHLGADLKWIRKYIDHGCDMIGIGGLVGNMLELGCQGWLDRVFNLVCDTPKRLPMVKLHGFGVSSHEFLWRYPWFSVDSAAWTKKGAYGIVLVPPLRRGEYRFDIRPHVLSVSVESPRRSEHGRHLLSLTREERKICERWWESLGIPFGKMDAKGNVLQEGIITCGAVRRIANVMYFEQVIKRIPPYPWPFRTVVHRGFGAV